MASSDSADINARELISIGIDIYDLKNIKTVIGVAGGNRKAEAILGAVRGKFIHVLVTDYDTVNEVLDLTK